MAAPHANWQEALKRKAYGAGITLGKHSGIMKSKELKRVCAVCANKLDITLNEDGTIASGGWFFETVAGTKPSRWEYWECNECYEDDNGE